MITAPVIHEFGSPPSCKDGSCRVPFALELSCRLGWLAGPLVRVGPLVQPLAIFTAEEIVGIGDVSVE
jgi:hypothetical protein